MGSKRVFITGGASGLGRALANRFADAGYSVCIGDVDDGRGAEALAELKAKGQAHYVNCDVTMRAWHLQVALPNSPWMTGSGL
jgi:NAD(P)-dependent dehydrogenase (short-subunit alcohol dehydrogenase family)